MSWDTIYYDKVSKCACGKGKVVQHIIQRDDDWNRCEISCTGEEICCSDCEKNFHISHLCDYHSDGIIYRDRVFLVPNGKYFPTVINEKRFYFYTIDEEIAANITYNGIVSAINDMKENRFTTRLKLSDSKSIVEMYYHKYKKKNIQLIVPVLEKIIHNYEKYEWTPEKIEEYRVKEQKEIENNHIEIEKVIAQSFELYFGR